MGGICFFSHLNFLLKIMESQSLLGSQATFFSIDCLV